MYSILFTFVLIEGFLLLLSDEGVNFDAKTTENSTCPDVDWQRCETLEFYLNNLDEIVNQHNVTFFFTSGVHKVYLCTFDGEYLPISPLNMKMEGVSNDTIIENIGK